MKLAIIQKGYGLNKKETIIDTENMIKVSAKNKAQLVLLPELHTSRYFCQTENIKNFTLADDFDKNIEIFSKIAKKYKIVLVTSLFEKRAKGFYHNSAVVFERDGSIAGKYRKMHIPHDNQFYEKFYFTPGDNRFRPIKTSLGNLGVLICWDQWFPEAARIMALSGADILIYPTAIGTLKKEKNEENRQINSWKIIQQSHAIANNLFVASINRVGIEKENGNHIDFWGSSFVCNPFGEILASGDKNEDIIYCDIDFKEIEETRKQWPFLRDRRVDFYTDINKKWIDNITF